MFEPMTRERLETIFETFKRDALIAGIAPPDWDKTIERVRDMAIEALRQADKAMTPEQLEARNKRINRLSLDLWDVYTDNDPEASTKNKVILYMAYPQTVTCSLTVLSQAGCFLGWVACGQAQKSTIAPFWGRGGMS